MKKVVRRFAESTEGLALAARAAAASLDALGRAMRRDPWRAELDTIPRDRAIVVRDVA